jgi:hypothetical protein
MVLFMAFSIWGYPTNFYFEGSYPTNSNIADFISLGAIIFFEQALGAINYSCLI